MSEPTDSKLVIPFMPSLFHFSVVKVALILSKHIDAITGFILFKEMRRLGPKKFHEANYNSKINKAKEKLLIVPAHLRENVVQAILGMDAAVTEWHSDHEGLWRLKNIEEIFQWKSDGAIDRIKTMQQLVLKNDVDIVWKFYWACSYFLEESIQTLWAEMKVCDRWSIPGNPFTRFWVRRMQDGCGVQWIKNIPEYLQLSEEYPNCTFGAFFPFLQLQEREKFLSSITKTTNDDFLLCMYGATKEEEEQILKMEAFKLLVVYLNWPLQNFFLQIVEKMWPFIDYPVFEKVLHTIFSYKVKKQDFDYEQLLVDMFAKSPKDFKEKANASQYLSRQIYFCFESVRMRKKRYNANLKLNSKKKRN
ncbi:uncharacterized protein LOC129960225 [Argiope bruennichi]|uniref:uncharacterized protein LOC129960225 n=1 Tax=Argiope bruennichi TaxID=94029 RepID=UPI002493ECBD|nr:uncharacterized protein LOC129960225 [Argiope bruennichi]XP_055929451.1 uncharacterized protein LOC129960225 [Argiope bruennichi]